MDYRYVLVLLTICAGTFVSTAQILNKNKVFHLNPGSLFAYEPNLKRNGFLETDLRIYCYDGSKKAPLQYFESMELLLDIEGEDFTEYEGTTPEEVAQHYEEKLSLFSFNLFTQKRTQLSLSPFSPKCIGIVSSEPYRLRLLQQRVDFSRVIMLAAGAIMFLYAGKLSHNYLFYYFTGIILGICSSFMLLIWLSSKLFPRRTMTYGVLIGGWTIGIYILQKIWENLQVIIVTYRAYVFWYIFVTGIVSFLLCYRFGPPKNERSKNIIKWLIQLISLLLIYLSSHFEEASASIIVAIIVVHYFPSKQYYKLKGFYLRYFPPKPRLLTNAEFYEQGVKETSKALDELRKYARSPECKQWKVMTKLKDPMRFASFVEGDSHLRDEEILSFEDSLHETESEESGLEDEYAENNLEQNDNEHYSEEEYVDGNRRIPNGSNTYRMGIQQRNTEIKHTNYNVKSPTNGVGFIRKRKSIDRRFQHNQEDQYAESDDY